MALGAAFAAEVVRYVGRRRTERYTNVLTAGTDAGIVLGDRCGHRRLTRYAIKRFKNLGAGRYCVQIVDPRRPHDNRHVAGTVPEISDRISALDGRRVDRAVLQDALVALLERAESIRDGERGQQP